MEQRTKTESRVLCPLHPSYVIQAVNMKESEEAHLFCLRCLFEQKELVLSQTQDLPELLKNASSAYQEKKKYLKFAEKPKEYLDFLSKKAEILENFSQHIEEEKKKTAAFFDQVAQQVLVILDEKKNQRLKELDQQLSKLCSNFAHFDHQLKKAFPTEEETPFLLSNYEVLGDRFESIDSFDQLSSFVNELKQDILDAKREPPKNKQEIDQDHVKCLHQLFTHAIENKPFCPQNDQTLSACTNLVTKAMEDFVKNTYIIQNLTRELSSMKNCGSNIVSVYKLYKIKEWLPPNHPFNPVLIYRSTRNDDKQAFHQFCDGKKNTVTLLKVLFERDDEPCVIGGFLDVPWHSERDFISSQNAFIFSLSSNIKCEKLQNNPEVAAYGDPNIGPRFGTGPDLEVPKSIMDKGIIYPNSYQETSRLAPKGGFYGCSIEFEIFEMEVFALD